MTKRRTTPRFYVVAQSSCIIALVRHHVPVGGPRRQ